MEKEQAKRALKTLFYFTYFTQYSGTDTQDTQKFIPNFLSTCRQFDMAQILNDCVCVA